MDRLADQTRTHPAEGQRPQGLLEAVLGEEASRLKQHLQKAVGAERQELRDRVADLEHAVAVLHPTPR